MNKLMTRLAFLFLVVAVSFVANDAHADLRAGLSLKLAEFDGAAERGIPGRHTVILTAQEALELHDIQLAGEGWTVLSIEALSKTSLLPGESVELSFIAQPSQPDRQLVLTAHAGGREVSLGIDLSERGMRASRGAMAGLQVNEEQRIPTADILALPPMPAPEVPDYPQVNGREEGEDQGPLAKAARNIRIRGDIGYYRDDGAWLSVDNCVVEIWENDVDPNPDDFIASTTTDALGNFDYTFFWDGVSEAEPDLYVVYRLDSSRTNVGPTTGGNYSWASTTTQNYSGTDLNIGGWTSGDPALYPAMHLFTNLQRTWRWIYVVGWDGPKVKGVFPDAGAPTGYYFNNEIHMSTGVQWEEDTISHEWGHHWAASFATSVFDTYCNGTCDASATSCGHCGWCDETEMVAWNEGFANLFGDLCPELWGTIYGEAPIHSNDIYEFETLKTCAGTLDDPQLTEGFVGALLRDIVDTTNDNHPQYAGSDQLGLGWDEVLTTVDLDTPQRPNEFLSAFTERYPQYFTAFNETAKNCGYADIDPPTGLSGLISSSHGSGSWLTDDTVTFTWNEPSDVWSGVDAYSVAVNDGSEVFPGFTPNLGDVTTWTTAPLPTGEYFVSVFPRDRAGNWASVYWWWGTARVIGSDGPDLVPASDGGWPYPMVPRSANDASYSAAAAPTTLPGNTAGTYINAKRKNAGAHETVGSGHVTRHFVDGLQRGPNWNAGVVGGGTVLWEQNQGPFDIAGGRHTVHLSVDVNGAEPERNESNNEFGRQWIWTPLATTAGTRYVRSAPPVKNAGHSAIPAGTQTIYNNSDGMRLTSGPDFWDALVVVPATGADLDLYAHNTLSSGATSGFDVADVVSARGSNALDVILVNRNTTGGDVDVGVINYNASSTSYAITHVTAPSGNVLNLGADDVFVLDGNTPLQMRELLTYTGQGAQGVVYLETEPATSSVQLRWFDRDTILDTINGHEGYATTGGDGRASLPLSSTVEGDYSMLMISRDPASGTNPVTVKLKVRAPMQASVEASAPALVSVLSVPDGSGRALTQAYAWDGVAGNAEQVVDATVTVRLVETITGNVVAGFPREDIRLVGPGVATCEGGIIADTDTDVTGQTTFSLAFPAGGSTGVGELSVVLIDAPDQVTTGSTQLRVNSPDGNGDLAINVADVGIFAGDYLGTYDYRSDFVWDGTLDLRDISEFAKSVGVSCGVVARVAADLPEDFVDAPDRLQLSFDEQGRKTLAGLRPGQEITAYLTLTGPAAREGIEAFEAAIEMSSNVRILSAVPAANTLDFSEGSDFRVGTDGNARSINGEPLKLMTLRLAVSDERPAHLWIRGSRHASLGFDVPVISVDGLKGDLRPALPPSGDMEMPVLSLNDGVTPDPEVVSRKGLELRNAPNPFNPATEIRFDLPHKGHVSVRIYDVSGRLVRELGGEVMDSGAQALRWNGTESDGSAVVSGVYFYRLTLDGDVLGSSQRMTLIK